MLTTIPEEEFLQLCEGISEANASKRNFNWTTMLKWSNTRDRINQYMATTNTKYIGAGSSRTAYYLPQGKYGPNKLETPACFKVAKNVKGVAQNKLEIRNLKKFSGDEWPCFPYLYDWDSKKKLFVLCEVGTSVLNGKIGKAYCDDWVKFYKSYEKENSNKDFKNKIDRMFGKFIAQSLLRPKMLANIFYSFSDIIDMLCELREKKKNADAKKVFNYIMNFLNEVEENYPKYNGITTTIKFCMDHKKEILANDFEASGNWAFVKRGKNFVAIPIDWGFNDEVARKYYPW